MAKFTDTDLIVALNIHGGNVTKAAEELGYRPQMDIDEGLRRTLLWYRDNRIAEEA